jgi:hypothetical protein
MILMTSIFGGNLNILRDALRGGGRSNPALCLQPGYPELMHLGAQMKKETD